MAVKLRQGESQDQLLKRFRKEVASARILSTYRKKRWYISKSELERKARKKALRKVRHRRR
ncbi:MAG: 30S ribosomal protein S21 [Ardenticatenales bacterium]|nr:30S ribosomal protein S21 [Ardenticatenales bacterium]MCB9172217.1 30S ribosomal protein S21 [Ardenticatenales bacterium]